MMMLAALAVVAAGWGVLAQVNAPAASWEDLLKGMVSQAFPVLLGFLVHWLGVRSRPAPVAEPDAAQTP